MSILPQPFLFAWENVERSAPILRMRRALDAMPDEILLKALEARRKGRRDDYPLRCMWRATLAAAMIGYARTSDLIAELQRNGELRDICGFDPLRGETAVPSPYAFCRFYALLEAHMDLIAEISKQAVEQLGELLEDMGQDLAVDSKALLVAGARPADADTGTKTYESADKEGNVRQVVQHWFGYKLHALIDARYELPLAWKVTEASAADSPELMPLVKQWREAHPELAARTKSVSADRAYDDGADKARLWDKYGIVPLIPPRDCFSHTGEPYKALDPTRHDTIYIGPRGEILCHIKPFESERAEAFVEMQYMGFEKDRETLKFRCPAAAYGMECKNRDACRCSFRVKNGTYGRVVRVPLDRDRRLLLPVHTQSRNFREGYKRRTSVERLFSRLDNLQGMEWALVRSRRRMDLRVTLILLTMQTTALAWIKEGQAERIRTLLSSVA